VCQIPVNVLLALASELAEGADSCGADVVLFAHGGGSVESSGAAHLDGSFGGQTFEPLLGAVVKSRRFTVSLNRRKGVECGERAERVVAGSRWAYGWRDDLPGKAGGGSLRGVSMGAGGGTGGVGAAGASALTISIVPSGRSEGAYRRSSSGAPEMLSWRMA
jgi:hypothetical protein